MVALWNRADYYIFIMWFLLSLWPPYVIGQAIIFLPCGFFFLLLSSFLPRLISAVADVLTIWWTAAYYKAEIGLVVWGTPANLQPPYVIGQAIYIFILSFVLLLVLFSRLISAVADWMSTILPHMVWL